ncbi:aldehyde dehydrogenase (NAD+) [Alternaria panax]|uniref:aldehyde dehydrogenase (NAD(+)) n=1 Tax=Alternaria panax TaxID=48097 RepID=A0AAD4IIR3_9PLEO|nr:aldehyde dehydrogenase (NAD+) [Alternaria panax]
MGLPEKIETRLFINGEFVESSNGKTFDIINPATLELVAKVHEASEQDTDNAGSYMKKLASLIRENNDELAALEASSMGRPVGEFIDAHASAAKWDRHAEAGYSVQGTTGVQTPGFVNMTFRQPYGVVAGIIPWNVPLLFLANKLAPALIVGNTVVLKSSEKAPLTSAKIATLVQQAGFPPGVIIIITGFGNVSGSILSHHMDVRALSFTGSSRTGRLIQAAAAKSNLKQVFLELGGKSPAVVFEDADLEKAVCMANSRIYVTGGGAPSGREGYYIKPTIFKDTPEDAKIMKEEIFGPVVNINVFKSEDEVLAKANATEYGLYASVYTKDIDRAMRFAKGLEAGTVGVNCTSPVTGADMPFGGYKSSGSGREGEPLYSLDNFLETKSVLIKIS